MVLRVEDIPVGKIRPNPQQVRKTFDKESIEELAASMRSSGQVVPIEVTESNGGFQLVSGERRLRAAKDAGLKTLTAVVRDVKKENLRLRALAENLAREDLPDLEKEEGIAAEWASGRWGTHNLLAKAIGIDHKTVTRAIEAAQIRKAESWSRTQQAPSSFLLGETSTLYKRDKDAARTVWAAAEKHSETGVTGGDRVHAAIKTVEKLAPPARKALAAGKIDLDQAEELAGYKEPETQQAALKELVSTHESFTRGQEARSATRKAIATGKAPPELKGVYDSEASVVRDYEDLWLSITRHSVRALSDHMKNDLGTKGKEKVKKYLSESANHLQKLVASLE